jgi:hypothetical protein
MSHPSRVSRSSVRNNQPLVKLPIPPAALCRRDAAHYVGGLSEKTLANWAAAGIGPRFRRLGKVHARTVYLRADLDLWLSQQAEG